MRSPEATVVRRAPLHPLLAKELREIVSGRALWTMLLILCPLVGYSFWQAVVLYGEASAAARDAPVLASGLSPLDGVLVPTFGALYIAVTLLFPFVAIRSLGREKETGALRLLLQLPYRVPTLIAAKMTAIFGAWLVALIPAASAVVIWAMLGGHLCQRPLESGLGALLSTLVAPLRCLRRHFRTRRRRRSSPGLHHRLWVLVLWPAGQARRVVFAPVADETLHLRAGTSVARSSPGCHGRDLRFARAVRGVAASGCHRAPGSAFGVACVAAVRQMLASHAGQDIGGPHRGSASFQPPISGLAELRALLVTVMAPEDPRYVDLRRNVLAKLERAPRRQHSPRRPAKASWAAAATGLWRIEYSMQARRQSRSTSRAKSPLLYACRKLNRLRAPGRVSRPLGRRRTMDPAVVPRRLPLLIVIAGGGAAAHPRSAARQRGNSRRTRSKHDQTAVGGRSLHC